MAATTRKRRATRWVIYFRLAAETNTLVQTGSFSGRRQVDAKGNIGKDVGFFGRGRRSRCDIARYFGSNSNPVLTQLISRLTDWQIITSAWLRRQLSV